MSSFTVVNTRYADGVYQSAALELPDNLSRYATGDTVHRPVIRNLLGVNLSILSINMYVYVHHVESAGLLVRAVRSYG